jgi:hypothetical protein
MAHCLIGIDKVHSDEANDADMLYCLYTIMSCIMMRRLEVQNLFINYVLCILYVVVKCLFWLRIDSVAVIN